LRQIISWVTEYSYKRSWLVALAAIFVLLFGFLTFTRVKEELIPDIELPIFTVIVQSPDAPPGELSSGPTAQIEDVASRLAGFKSSQSTVVNGLSVTLVNLDYGNSIDDAERTMNEELGRLNLGPNVTTSILKFDVSLLPIVTLSLEGDLSQSELTDIANNVIVPGVQAIDGVEAVDVVGGAVNEVAITVNRDQMLAAGLTLDSLAAQLQANNVVIPSGALATGNTAVPLETIAIYRSLDDIRGTVLKGTNGSVTLADIATVEERQGAGTGRNRTNGQPAVGISVAKAKDANTVSVAEDVRDRLDAIETSLPAGASITIFQDQSEMITESVNSVIEEGIIGGILAIIVVFIFLANWRTTIITAVSIPLSIISAVIILDRFGYSLNLMTLGGLTIAIGRVIDDSIVVLENVYRHMANGERGFTAIMNGAREVTIAILGATATTCAVFLPLGLVGGLIGQLFLPFAIAVVAALIASLVIAVTVIPVLARYALAGRVKVEEERKASDTLLGRAYAPLLGWALNNRWKTLAAAGLLFIASLGLVPLLPVAFLGDTGDKIITVNVDARPGQTQESVLQQAIAIEDLLPELSNVDRYQTVITGASDDFGAIGQVLSGRGTNSATITVELHSGGLSKNAAAERFRQILADRLPDGDNVSVSASGGGFGGQGVAVTVAAESPDAVGLLPDVTARLTDEISQIKDTANVKNDLAAAQRTVSVTVDPQHAAAAGLQPADVANALSALSSTRTVTSVDLGDGTLPVRMRLTTPGTDSVASLGALEIVPGVRLDSIADLSETTKQVSITRVDGQLAATINGDIISEDQGTVSSKVQSVVRGFDAPEGVDVKVGGVGSDIEQGFADMLVAIGISIVLVYVIMALLFGSWVDPFVILFSLPLAIIGAIVALLVTGSTLSISALIGLLMLVGIVVTNAIVMLEFVIMLRHERGYSIHDALMEGAQTRLRPILMTAIAAMLALVPLSLGLTEGALIASDLGRTVIGGLFSSTLLTLFVVPVVYSLVHDFRHRPAQQEPVLVQEAQ
jgi:HAE1 family hydrophobic/amphiphilic exporter-1